jgi:hypothetical protein
MFVEARVVIGQTPRPVVPATALVRRGKSWRAFVVVKDELQERVVQRGADPRPDTAAIVKGVEKGEKVVSPITEQVVDGARVQL